MAIDRYIKEIDLPHVILRTPWFVEDLVRYFCVLSLSLILIGTSGNTTGFMLFLLGDTKSKLRVSTLIGLFLSYGFDIPLVTQY